MVEAGISFINQCKIYDMLYLLIGVVVVAAVKETNSIPVVDTEGGKILGVLEESLKGRPFFSFYGIPYAEPPIGKLRFQNPVARQPWDGTLNASTPASVCPQYHFADLAADNVIMLGQEDCLYLNVFTPLVKRNVQLPVMVWIHGGAFRAGSAREYRPYALLDKDVVLVVIQYRLGVLGFLSTEDNVMPGNLGLKDQTMALQWVRRNIHHFNGDKTSVTIFGESAGAASTHFMMFTPSSKGLFSRAIMQSGTAICSWAINNNPRMAAFEIARKVGCPVDEGSLAILNCLQDIEANVLFPLHKDFLEWVIVPVTFCPWVDGDYLPAHPAQLLRDGNYSQVDIMSGITKHDGALFILPLFMKTHFVKDLQNNFRVVGPVSLDLRDKTLEPEAVAGRMYLHYLGTTYPLLEAHGQSLVNMFTDRFFGVCHDVFTERHAALHPAKKTYRYELQHFGQLSYSKILCPPCDFEWVCHVDDLYYLYPGFPFTSTPKEGLVDLQRRDDIALRGVMVTLWTNFAATSDPTPDDSLGFTWNPSTTDNLHHLLLTPSPSMQPDNRKLTREFHSSLPTRENLILAPHLVEQHQDDSSRKTEL